MRALLIPICLLFAQATALAAPEPGVWDRLQADGQGLVKAFVSRVTVADEGVQVEVVTTDDGRTIRAPLCDDGLRSGEVRAALITHDRVRQLRESRAAKQPVEFALSGPWNPCLRVAGS